LKKVKNLSDTVIRKTTVFEQSHIKDMIIWWEKRRLIYNVLVIALSIFSIYSYWDYPMRTVIGSEQIIINAIVFVLGANLFYTLSWGSGIISYYSIDKKYASSNRKRWIFFTLGTIFSLILTNWHFVIEFDVLFAH
jgi:hypothetical protein